MSAADPTHFPTRRPTLVQFGAFRFDRAERILTRDGEEVRLPPRVLGVLEILLEREGKVVGKQELIDTVWAGAFVTDTSLTEAISVLRQALGDEAQDPRYLQTVHRRGYRFIAPVQPVIATAPAPPVALAVVEQSVTAAAPSRRWAAIVGLTLVVFLTTAIVVTRSRRATPPPAHVTLATPAGDVFTPSLAIAPNGREVVYGAERGGKALLFRRSLDGFDARPIEGTENGFAPFFSPNGEWVAFFTGTTLSKVKLTGGAPIVLCRTIGGNGGTWTRDGWIIFAATTSGLRRVREAGGEPEVLTSTDPLSGEVEHTSPQILPDGKSLLYTIASTTVHGAKVALLSLDSRERRVLLNGAAGARYVAPGLLVYATSDAVRVAPFDQRHGRISGEPFAVVPGVLTDPFGDVFFDVSSEGTAVFFAGTMITPENELVRRDSKGDVTSYPTPKRFYRNVEVAPDGRRAAVTILDGDRSDVWVADLQIGTLSRLTFDGFNIEPVWSPDGEWVYYASNRSGPYNIYRRRADGDGPAERLRENRTHEYPLHWSPDGKTLVISEVNPKSGFDIALLERSRNGWRRRPFVQTPGTEIWGEVSPDGRWIAYSSHQGAEWNVHVQDFPAGRSKWQISTDGGLMPFWSSDGTTLHYMSGEGVTSVPLTFVNGGIRRGRDVVIAGERVKVAQRGENAGEVTMIRATKPHTNAHELRMIIGWAGSLRR